MDIYAQNILDHYKRPRNFGKLKKFTASKKESNISCGDEIEMQVLLTKNKVSEFKFQGVGCSISQASASILGEYILGMSIQKILSLTKKDLIKLLGVEISKRREKCALLGLLALQNSLLAHEKKNQKVFSDLTDEM